MNRFKSRTTKLAIFFDLKIGFSQFYKVTGVINILTFPMSKDFLKKYVLRAMKYRSDSEFFNES